MDVALTVPGTRPRFFPLHLKFMLSYLVLAAAILTVSSAFAWRQGMDDRTQQQTNQLESSFTQARQEFDRRLERAIAVVNLAAATPQVTNEIISRGTMDFGPAASSDQSSYAASARFVPVSAADSLNAAGIDLASGSSGSGAIMLNGQPEAVALSPVVSNGVTGGYILVSVDLSPALDALSNGGQSYFLTQAGSNGSLVAISGSEAPVQLSADDLNRLASGNPVEVARDGSNHDYFPLPSPSKWPILAISTDSAQAASASSGTNPLLGLAVLTLAMGLFIAHFLARTLSRPVEQITEATERVAAGDIAYQLPHQKGRDELAVLGESFNRMTRKYSVAQSEVEAARERLEQTVIAQDAEIETLFGISRAITSVLDVDQLLEQALELSMPMFGSRAGVVWLDRGALESGSPLRDRAELPVAITSGALLNTSLPADDPLLAEMVSREWQLSVWLPESHPGAGDASRQLFFSGVEGGAPLRQEVEEPEAGLEPPDITGQRADTLIAVPIAGHKGFASGMLALAIPGRRELSGHEALLIFNIVGLASVAVENAGLYGLAQKRGEQIQTLLRESHHRITNNLAGIVGMLSAQLTKAKSADAAAIIRDNIARIQSIAQVHRLLSGELRDQVEVTGMMRIICKSAVDAGGERIKLQVSGPDIIMPAKRATAVALIANELVINSIKHGFSTGAAGKIDISISLAGEEMELDYHDNGRGIDISHPAGLGTQIIGDLVKHELRGRWSQDSTGKGYSARIVFPLLADTDEQQPPGAERRAIR